MNLLWASTHFMDIFKIYTQYTYLNNFFIAIRLFFAAFINLSICNRARNFNGNGPAKPFLTIWLYQDQLSAIFVPSSEVFFERRFY